MNPLVEILSLIKVEEDVWDLTLHENGKKPIITLNIQLTKEEFEKIRKIIQTELKTGEILPHD